MKDIQLLLFDLGGVLVDFSGPRDLIPFLRTRSTPGEILERWVACPDTTAFESQRISAEDWAARFVNTWDLTITPERFLMEFTGWSRGLLPGARELLAELRPSFRLAALSNSNSLHWRRNAELGIPAEFEFAMSSHEIGSCKPEPAIFNAVLARSRLRADQILFFDDVERNVDGARNVGLHARQVVGVEGVRQCLVHAGLL